ncbi:MAG: cell division protein FtsA [Acidobacteria bacterium]|nr:cell division protein FtsA [Acidobacteriota bacterium]
MAFKSKDVILSALDIGTSKVSAAVCHCAEVGRLDVLGYCLQPTAGIRNGVVVDLDALSRTIEACVTETERRAQVRMKQPWVSISARGLKSFNSSGGITLGNTAVPITENHLQKCIDAARNITLSNSLEPLHYVMRKCLVDNNLEVDNPVKMEGTRLEVGLHILALPKTQITHFTKAVNQAGLAVGKMLVEPLAAAEAVLTPEEKEFGCLLLSIGSCNTTALIFQKGKLQHSFCLPVGGDNFTRDIIVGLRTTLAEAERVKQMFAAMDLHAIEPNEMFDITSAGSGRTRQIARQILAEIIQPRTEEILEMVKASIEMAGFENTQLTSVVLCGGGSLLNQLVPYTEKFTDIPSRLGMPVLSTDLPEELHSPIHAALLGLLVKAQLGHTRRPSSLTDKFTPELNFLQKTSARFRHWLQEIV